MIVFFSLFRRGVSRVARDAHWRFLRRYGVFRLFLLRLDLLVDIFFSMIFLIIVFHVFVGALLGVLERLFGLGSRAVVWKIHPVHALLGEPPLA